MRNETETKYVEAFSATEAAALEVWDVTWSNDSQQVISACRACYTAVQEAFDLPPAFLKQDAINEMREHARTALLELRSNEDDIFVMSGVQNCNWLISQSILELDTFLAHSGPPPATPGQWNYVQLVRSPEDTYLQPYRAVVTAAVGCWDAAANSGDLGQVAAEVLSAARTSQGMTMVRLANNRVSQVVVDERTRLLTSTVGHLDGR